MKKILISLIFIIIIFASYILFNTLIFSSKQVDVKFQAIVDIAASAKDHLSQAITIPIISPEDSAAFYEFRDFIRTTYSLSDSLMEVEYINEFSMIFKWQGTQSDLKPVILLGHLDVVPVAEENRESWQADPFGGEIRDGQVWGRGAIDDKISVIGTLEAVEFLLSEGYVPKRTLYLCFGHDEELGGLEGAVAIVEHLKKQNVKAEFVLDEGFAITQGLVPGIERDVALIGTAEKGFLTLELSVNLEGGHSSMPGKETAIDVLSRAIVKLRDNPFPPYISQPVRDFMAHAGPEMSFVQKMAFANPAIFKPMIVSTYEKKPSGNALIRTTIAPTIINAGIKENVIPYRASASVNFRTLPGTSINDVKERVANIIADDRIKTEVGEFSSEAPESSSTSSFGYQTINTTIKQIFPQAITTPNLVLGATDSRHYYALSSDVYRFIPFYLHEDNVNTFHGINERIPVEDFNNTVWFYIQLIRNATQ